MHRHVLWIFHSQLFEQQHPPGINFRAKAALSGETSVTSIQVNLGEESQRMEISAGRRAVSEERDDEDEREPAGVRHDSPRQVILWSFHLGWSWAWNARVWRADATRSWRAIIARPEQLRAWTPKASNAAEHRHVRLPGNWGIRRRNAIWVKNSSAVITCCKPGLGKANK